MQNFTRNSMCPQGIDTIIEKLKERDDVLHSLIDEIRLLLKEGDDNVQIFNLIEKLAKRISWQLDFKKFNPAKDKDGKTSLAEQIADWDNKYCRDCKLATTTLALLLDSFGIPLSISFYGGGAHPYLIFKLADSVFAVSFKEENALVSNTDSILNPWTGIYRGPHEVYNLENGLEEMENRFLFARSKWEEA